MDRALSSPYLEVDDAGGHDDKAHDGLQTRYAASMQRWRLEAMEEEEPCTNFLARCLRLKTTNMSRSKFELVPGPDQRPLCPHRRSNKEATHGTHPLLENKEGFLSMIRAMNAMTLG
ncbi:hypothetical protein Bca4012_066525 [Brassica carinata]|uniref:Uncharacterized protein n=1 Tax=Brassica carinata TaxID=52824 RepID=A0A8X7VQR2_BRACI|nr:hypothetical protein Bca52824_018846 [Brassica carinata]